MALALVGCESLPWAQADNEADLARINLLNQQLVREAQESPPPDPCAAIRHPGDRAPTAAYMGYYVAVAGCTSARATGRQPAAPASVQIAEEFADAEKAKAKNSLARSRIWVDGILGVLSVAKDLHIAEEARESAERIADREAETPPDGSVWVQGGGQYVVHTDSHNDSSDRRSNFDNDQSDRRSDYANDKADRRVTDSHNDNSDRSVLEDYDTTTDSSDHSDHSVTEDNDVTTTDQSDHSVTEDNDSTSTTTSDSHNQDNDVTTTTDNRIHEDNDVTLTTGDGGFVEHYGGNAQVEKGSPPIVPPGNEEEVDE